MSLNHLIQGGAPVPALNLECENLKVLGTLQVSGQIQTGAFQSESFDPTITVTSTGANASLVSKVNASAIRIGNETTVTYRCVVASGTGAAKLTVAFEPPIWTPDTVGIVNTSCVLNCTHLRGDGEWESLINQGAQILGTELVVTVGKEDNTVFPVTKDFTLTARFTYTQ